MKKKLGEDDCRGCGVKLKGKRIDKKRLCRTCYRKKMRLANRKNYHKYHPSAIFYRLPSIRRLEADR